MECVLLLLLLFIIVSQGIENDHSDRSLIINSNNQGNLPKVFLLGPQKSGSSSLFEFLVKHPQLCGGLHKEENYISNDVLFSKGHREGYKAMFKHSKCHDKSQTMYIDASPQFSLMQKVLPRFPQIFTKQEMQVIII